MTEQDLRIEYEPVGTSGRICVRVHVPGGEQFVDKFDCTSSRSREEFLERLCKEREGLDRVSVRQHLEGIASELVETLGSKPDEGSAEEPGDDSHDSQAAKLVALARAIELFHTPGGHDSEGYATILVEGHRETWPISSRGFSRWMSREFFVKERTVPNQQALRDALNVLSGKAVYEGEELDVAVRLTECENAIYLDLANAEWEVVEITANGWRILPSTEVPVRFVRKRGTKPLPRPVSGGSLDQLRELVNLENDDDWILFVSVVISYLHPRGPYIVLIVIGERGSAKSTLCRFLRALVDPNIAPLRRPPRGDRELMIAAKNGRILAFENLSRISADMSDALCTLATGGGFGARELYTNDDEALFDATRPVLLNGINQMATRGDLLDRAITLSLPVIPEDKRRTEEEVTQLFEERRPGILGALLDVVSSALRNMPNVTVGGYPRMADFARLAEAAAPALGWDAERFQAAYVGNRTEGDLDAIQSSPVGPLLVKFLDERDSWVGSATQLRDLLGTQGGDEVTKRKDWPKNAQTLGWELKRLAPSLRALGYEVSRAPRDTGKQRTRRYHLQKRGSTLSARPGWSENPPVGFEGTIRTDNPDASEKVDGPQEDGPYTPEDPDSDHPDHPDNPVPTYEEEAEWKR